MAITPTKQYDEMAKKILARRALRDQNTVTERKGPDEVRKLADEKVLVAAKEAEEAIEAQRKADKEKQEAEAAKKEAEAIKLAAKSDDPYEELKNKDLKKLLDKRTPPVPYPKSAKRSELIALLEQD